MALLDFPSGPGSGDTYSLNGNTWKWNGTSWVAFNNLSLSTQVSGILAVQYGGTGFGGTYAIGDILYASASNAFTKLSAGTAGSVLASGGAGAAPYWKVDDSGTGSVGNGTSGGFAYYNGLNTITSGTAFSYINGSGAGGTGATVVLTQSSLSLIGSTITSGTWAGSAITAKYGGTGLSTLSAGDLIYGSAADTYSRLTHSGSAGSILVTVGTSGVAWTLGSSLTVGIANSLNTTTDTSSTLYLLGTRSNGGFAGTAIYVDSNISFSGNTITGNLTGTASIATSSVVLNTTADTTSTLYLLGTRTNGGFAGTALYVDTGISALGNTLSATTFVGSLTGTATTATRALNTDITLDTTSTIYITGSRSNASIGSTPTYVLSGVSALGNTLSATTFVGSLTGTASIATSVATTADTSNTLYLLGSRTSTGVAATAIYVDSSISFVGNTITGNLTGTASIATSSVVLNTTADTTSTLYLLGTRTNGGFAGTALYVDTGISALGNTISATTFVGALTGTASIATSVATITDVANNLYLLGSRSSTGVAATAVYVDTNVYVTGSTITATTFSGNLSGTAVTATHYGSGLNLTGIVTSLTAGNGIQVSSATGNVTVSNIGVTTITGTANRISVSSSLGSSNGAITLSTPQDIATNSAVTFDTVSVRAGSLTTTSFSNATDIVNKQYVDNLASGLDIHGSVRLIATSGLGASYVQSSIGGSSDAIGAYLISTTQVALPAIDGVTISATGVTQRILVAGGLDGKVNIGGTGYQASTGVSYLANGIYYVTALGGSGTSNWILTRATDTDTNTELTAGTFTFVEEGTSYADTGWVCSNDTTNFGPIGFGITQINFTQFTGAAAFNVGQGLSKTGNYVSTKVNLTSTGTASGTGFTQFNIGGVAGGATGDTGYYPTFSVRTSSTIAGSATLTLNNDGFSLIGSTGTARTLTVTGGDITLNGGSSNTLTLTGSISLPQPQQYRLAWGVSGTAISFLPVGGASSVLFQTNNTSDPIWVGQSSLSVGNASIANSSVLLNTTTDTSSTLYLLGTRSNGGFAGTAIYVDSSISVVGNTITGNLTGTASIATSSVVLNTTADTTSTLYLLGTRTNGGFAGTALYVDTGISALGNTITATTFVGSLTGTASIATSVATTADTSNTLYLLGSRTSTGVAGTAIYVDSSVSVVGNTITGNLTGTASIATSSVVLNTTADTTSTLYLLGTRTNGGFAGTALYVDTGISALGNTLSATTFVGSLTGTATTATRALNTDITLDTTSTIYITGSRSNAGIGSTPTYVLSGVSALGNTLSATTFVGSLTGTASIATSVATTADTSNTLYLLGSRTSTGVAGTAIYVDSSISVVGNTITGNLTGTASIASSAVVLNTTADTTSTLYLLGTRTNGGFAGTALYVDTGISALGNTITATTFSGVATSATRVGITTSVSTSDLPIVFADAHQPYAALGSSTLLTYQASSGKITNGIWAGTAITTRGGGTGFNTVNANQVLMGAATGNTWAAVASTNIPVVGIGSNPPTAPLGAIGATQAGQLWWDSTYGVLKVYYTDGDSTSQWVDATPVLGSSGGGSSTKRSYVMTFGAGFTPSTGADTVQILIPYAPDNTSKYYYIKRLDYRAETAGTGVSFYIERFTGGNAAFSVSTGNRIHSASGASFVAASGTFITSYTQSSSGASFVSSSGVAGSIISGDYLRLNFSHINSAATMSVSMVIEEQ